MLKKILPQATLVQNFKEFPVKDSELLKNRRAKFVEFDVSNSTMHKG
jgi:hypothetical protein